MIELSEAQWTAVKADLVLLVSRVQATDPLKSQEVEQLWAEIDRQNSIQTYVAWVRWRDANAAPPRMSEPPASWPPQYQAQITLAVPITKQYLVDFVAARTPNPAGIWITRDPAGLVGWTSASLLP